MSANARHQAAVARAATVHSVRPVDVTTLPAITSRRADTAREVARRRMDDATAERTEADAELSRQRATWATTERKIQTAERAVDEATARIAQLTEAADQAAVTLEELDVQRQATSDALRDATSRADELDSFATDVDDTVTALLEEGVTPQERAALSARLDELSATASSCTVGAAALGSVAAALSNWAHALADDTAPIDPTAEALLDQLLEHEERWERHASGDLMGDPAVLAARAKLEQARTDLVELESRASVGAAGNRAKQAIEAAHRQRTAIESRGSKADPAELQAAIEAETAALRHVGFDSMLDYRITLSTGGGGALEEAQRATVRARIEQLESELEQTLRDTPALHDTLRSRLDAVREEIDTWLGVAPTADRVADRVAALRGRLAEPADVATARGQLAQDRRTLRADATARVGELAEMDSERAEVEERRSAHLTEAERADDDRRRAETTLTDARDRLDALGVVLQQLSERSEQAADELDRATAGYGALTGRRYLDEDVHELRDAMLAEVTERCSSEHVDGVVIDDPLGDLDDADARAVLDELCARTWPLPILFVSSRGKLLAHLRRRGDAVTPVDGRRRATGRRWFRRSDELESIAG